MTETIDVKEEESLLLVVLEAVVGDGNEDPFTITVHKGKATVALPLSISLERFGQLPAAIRNEVSFSFTETLTLLEFKL